MEAWKNELYHHGILGMKWGVRRYQNPDGSLTPEGYKRYYGNSSVATKHQAYKDTKNAKRSSFVKQQTSLMKASYIPTRKNREALSEATDNYNHSKQTTKQRKLEYETSKERARLDSKNIEISNKSDHRTKLEAKYREMGMSVKDAEAAANKRIQTEKFIATAAGVTVGAAAAMYLTKGRIGKADQIIKAGKSLQRIEYSEKTFMNNALYTSITKHDNKRYERTMFPMDDFGLGASGKRYVKKFTFDRDIKVASESNARDVFNDLYKKDKEFRENLKGFMLPHTLYDPEGLGKVTKIEKRNAYTEFNRHIVDMNHASYLETEKGSAASTVLKKYENALKEAGYDAIQDLNDKKYSGYNSDNPLIVFNKEAMNIASIEELGGPDEQVFIENAKMFVERLINPTAVGATAYATNTIIKGPSNPYEDDK